MPILEEGPHSVFDAWYESQPVDWRSAVMSVAHMLWEASPAYQRYVDPVNHVVDRLFHSGQQDMGRELEEAVADLRYVLLGVGATLGYALAATWTGKLEDLASWPERARLYAGVDDGPPSAMPEAQS
jgi:hypothetical protein